MPAKNIITISFDDGTFADKGVIDRIREIGGTATFYLVSHHITEAVYPINENLYPGIRRFPEGAVKLYDGFEVGGHCTTHWKFCKIKEDPAEILECKPQIEEIFKREIKCFAYPYGHVHDQETVRKAGFEFARTVRQAWDLTNQANAMEMPTTSTLNINFATNIFPALRDAGTPIHLVGHSWQLISAGFNTLEVMLKAIKDSKYKMVTNYEFFRETFEK